MWERREDAGVEREGEKEREKESELQQQRKLNLKDKWNGREESKNVEVFNRKAEIYE